MLLNDLAQYGPRACIWLSPSSPYEPLYRALVCGTPLPPSKAQWLFLDTGLVHLMIVSGAHLAFLDRLMSKFPGYLRIIFLSFYSWLTGFGPPVVRALANRCLFPFCQKRGFGHLQTELLSSLILLCIHPRWLTSRSFLMSWMCSLALSLPYGHLTLRCFVFLYPFAATAPISLFWNLLITPLVGHLLFPFCLMSFLVHSLSPFTDFFWLSLLQILEWGPKAPPAYWFLRTSSLAWLPLFLHILLIQGEIRWRRAWAFSYSS